MGWAVSLPMLIMRSRFTLTTGQLCECKRAKKLWKCFLRVVKNSSLILAQLREISLLNATFRTISRSRWSSLIGSFWQQNSMMHVKPRKPSKKRRFSQKWTRFRDLYNTSHQIPRRTRTQVPNNKLIRVCTLLKLLIYMWAKMCTPSCRLLQSRTKHQTWLVQIKLKLMR